MLERTTRGLCLAGALLATALAGPLAAEAAQLDNINVAVNGLPEGLDPAFDTGNVNIRVYYSIFDTLIRRDFGKAGSNGAGYDLVPALATSWSWTNPTTFEVKLRQGVTCQDGNPFNADDVTTTFSKARLWGPDSYYPEGRTYFGNLAAVNKVDDFTVDFVTKAPDPTLAERLSSYTAFVVCNEALDAYKKPGMTDKQWLDAAFNGLRWHPVGTGPYKAAGYQQDNYVKLEAFDKAWEGQPASKAITFKAVPEIAARVAGLVSGDFDIAVELPPDQWDVVKGYDNLALKTVVLENSHVLVFNMADPVLSDQNLRQALSLSIDRRALIDALWGGQSYTPNGHQLASFGALYDPDRKGYVYDLDKAKALLAKSSYKGQEITYRLRPNYYLYSGEAAQILQEMWRKAGINVKLEYDDTGDQLTAPGAQIYAWSNTFRSPDPTGAIIPLYGPGTKIQKNGFFKAPPEFNELAKKLQSTTDVATRKTDFQHMLDIFEELMPATLLYNPADGYGMKKTINWQPYVQYYMDFRPSNFSIANNG